MRKLLSEPLDPADAGASLNVIAAFDDCLSDGGALEDLVKLGAGLLGRGVTVMDELNDRLIGWGPTSGEGDLAKRVAAELARGRQAVELTVCGTPLLAVPVDHGGGRLGVAWTRLQGSDAPVLDELILERLARAAASRILQDRESAQPREPGRADALGRLLAGDMTADMVGALCRRARIEGDVRYRVAVLVGRPVGASPEVLLARAQAAYGSSRNVAGCVVVGRTATLLLVEDEAALSPLREAVETIEGSWHLMVGVSRPHPVDALPAALLEARRVVALSNLAEGGVENAEDVGLLLLLASVPADIMRADEDVQRATRLLEPASHQDVAMLETYCATGSLRKTAAHFYLHHSSVDYHLKRLERDLGFDISTRTGQLRALLAIRLARLVHAGLVAERETGPTVVG